MVRLCIRAFRRPKFIIKLVGYLGLTLVVYIGLHSLMDQSLPQFMVPRIADGSGQLFSEGSVQKSTESNKLTVLQRVCVRSRNRPVVCKRFSNNYWYVGKERIQLPARDCPHPQKAIEVFGSPHFAKTFTHGFSIQWRTGSMPASYKRETATAYFMGYDKYFAPENFFHFMKQFVFPLHHLADFMNQLKPGSRNVPFYHRPWGRCPGHFSRFRTKEKKFDRFFKLLHVDDVHINASAFEDQPYPDWVCYKQAVFSDELFTRHASGAIKYIQDQLKVNRTKCSEKIVVIIKRNNRRILNEQELLHVALSMGYDARLIAMETLSLEEQVQLIYCTHILIGVTGAGLQWAYFMQPYSNVVEIAWPTYSWPFFFSGTNRYNSGEKEIMPLKFFEIAVDNCHIEPSMIHQYLDEAFHVKSNVSDNLAQAIINDKQNYNFKRSRITSLGKLCDVVVYETKLRDILLKIKSKDKQ